ncbi:MAG: hypothetical protein KC502_07725 [Myxococcales bacterium]|nr:hypothetical protein [Myxococcales bacterium]
MLARKQDATMLNTAQARRWPAKIGQLLAWVTLAGVALSCNDYPVHSLLETFEVRVTDKLSGDKPVKLDFLWVIDHSPSMCQEQRDLAAAFSAFTETLKSLGAIDARMAVVSVQQVPDKVDIKVVGRFSHRAAKLFPPNCFERVVMPCLKNDDCTPTKPTAYPFPVVSDASMCVDKKKWTNPYVGGKWECDKLSSATLTSNLNCSINSKCVAKCTSDADCRAIFEPKVPKGKQRSICKNIAGVKGCMFPPDTADCPTEDKLPAVLEKDNLDLFRCNATLGAASTQEAGFEGGFRSAWTALDPEGPNCSYDACVKSLRACCTESKKEWCTKDFNQAKCDKDKKKWCEPLKDKKNCQYNQLVRDDAYLVLVFISDDDDCSMNLDLNPLNKDVILKEVWQRCQTYGDALGGNKELSAGFCEYRRKKNLNYYCDSDCTPGSTNKDKAGLLKCPKGCKAGSKEQLACQAKADVDTDKFKKTASQFAPVSEFVNRFKSLKDDPSRVIVAAISGDTTADAKFKSRDRVNYYHSMLLNQGPGQVPYVCRSDKRGEAGYGSRYVQLAEAFRDNGVVQNICAGSDFGPALKSIATTILKRVIKVCLPQPPYTGEDGQPMLTVTRRRGDGADAETMEYGDGPQPGNTKSFYIAPSPDCRSGKTGIDGESSPCKETRDCSPGLTCIEGFCQVYNDAVFFSEVPDPKDKIEINYAADLGL